MLHVTHRGVLRSLADGARVYSSMCVLFHAHLMVASCMWRRGFVQTYTSAIIATLSRNFKTHLHEPDARVNVPGSCIQIIL